MPYSDGWGNCPGALLVEDLPTPRAKSVALEYSCRETSTSRHLHGECTFKAASPVLVQDTLGRRFFTAGLERGSGAGLNHGWGSGLHSLLHQCLWRWQNLLEVYCDLR